MAENKTTETAVAEKKTDKKPKTDKPSLFARIGKFFKDFKSERKKVTWASKEDTMKNFVVVAITVVIAGVAIGVLDLAFSEGIIALGNLI